MKSLLPIILCIGLCGCLGTAMLLSKPQQPQPEPQTQIVILQVQPATQAADFRENLEEKDRVGWPAILIISSFMLLAPAIIIKMKGF